MQDVSRQPEMQEVLNAFKSCDLSEHSSNSHPSDSAKSAPVKAEPIVDGPPNSKPQEPSGGERFRIRKRKTVVKSIEGQYSTWFGILIWRTEVIRVLCESPHLGAIQHDELQTSITVQPSSWLLARQVKVQISRKTQGWTCNLHYYRKFPDDALIFEYCSIGNLEGVRDLLQHKLASPWDLGTEGNDPLL